MKYIYIYILSLLHSRILYFLYIYTIYIMKAVSQRKYVFFFCYRILFVHFVITGKLPVKSVTSYFGSVLRKRSILKHYLVCSEVFLLHM